MRHEENPAPGLRGELDGRGDQSTHSFLAAQERLFDRHGLIFDSLLVDVASIGGTAHVIVTGEGPPVLMVIGGGIVAGTWAPLMAELGGYTLYAVDLPGQGLTDRVPYSAGTLRRTAVSFLDEVMDALVLETVPLVGQSVGGTWSTWMALDRPERVSAIAYIGCPATLLGTSAPLPLRLGTVPWINRLLNRLDPPSDRQVERLGKMAGEDLSRTPELRDLMLEYERLPGSSQSLLEMHRSLIRVRGALPEVELTEDQLRRLAQPVQFLWGDNDPFGPPAAGFRAAKIITDSEMHVVPGGHAPWFGDPRGVGSLVNEFLAKHTTGARR
jgi:pimeloyl-ACP methyl ester carboxylesterase